MASLRMTLLDLLNKSEEGADPNFLRDGVQLLAQELMTRGDRSTRRFLASTPDRPPLRPLRLAPAA
jgi:hypothetical protein